MLIDRLGRRALLLISEILMVIALVSLGTYFYIRDNDLETALTLPWLPVTSLIVFIAGFSIGLGPIPWLMMGELVPERVKGPATSAATFFNWGLAFAVTLSFNSLKQALTDAGAFWFFAAICSLATLFCGFIVPETKGKTSAEIQANFGN